MYLLIKKPLWLDIISKEYIEGEKVNKLQIRQKKENTNTKLIKCKDGSYYIKIGEELFPIKMVSLIKKIHLGKEKEIIQEIKEKGYIIKEIK